MPTFRLFIPFIAFISPLLFLVSGCGSSSNSDGSPPPDHSDAPRKTVAIHGTVQDQQGQPAAGILVMPEAKGDHPFPIPEIAVFTDEQGKFIWNLPPGDYDFVLTRNGSELGRHPVKVPDGKANHELQLVIQAEK